MKMLRRASHSSGCDVHGFWASSLIFYARLFYNVEAGLMGRRHSLPNNKFPLLTNPVQNFRIVDAQIGKRVISAFNFMIGEFVPGNHDNKSMVVECDVEVTSPEARVLVQKFQPHVD
jgi:hypothetical protein